MPRRWYGAFGWDAEVFWVRVNNVRAAGMRGLTLSCQVGAVHGTTGIGGPAALFFCLVYSACSACQGRACRVGGSRVCSSGQS